MGFGRFVKRTFLTLLTAATIAYFGDTYNFRERIDKRMLYSHREVEAGFYNPLELEKKIVINDHGQLETYLIANEVYVPVKQGTNGPVFSIDYELSNLSPGELYAGIVQSWSKLSQDQKMSIARQEVEAVLSQRYQELEDVLKDFFTVQGGGD